MSFKHAWVMIDKPMSTNDNLLLSIIMPLYDVAHWLAESLNSLLTEIDTRTTAIEIILFDDGSNDETALIAQGYEKRYPDIIQFHSHGENRGPGIARNAALLLAQGDYIWFFDGDDIAGKGLIISIMDQIRQSADLMYLPAVYFNRHRQWHDKQDARIEEFVLEFGTTVSMNRISRNQAFLLPFAPWRLVFKRSCLIGAPFCPTDYTEDLYFFLKLLLSAESLIIIRNASVMYRRRKGQLTSTNHESLWSLTKTYRYIMDDIIKSSSEPQIWNVFLKKFHGKLRHVYRVHPVAYTLRFRRMIRDFWRLIPKEKRRDYQLIHRIGGRLEITSIEWCLFPEVTIIHLIMRVLVKAFRTISWWVRNDGSCPR